MSTHDTDIKSSSGLVCSFAILCVIFWREIELASSQVHTAIRATPTILKAKFILWNYSVFVDDNEYVLNVKLCSC